MDVKVPLKCHQMPKFMHEELALTYIEFFLVLIYDYFYWVYACIVFF